MAHIHSNLCILVATNYHLIIHDLTLFGFIAQLEE